MPDELVKNEYAQFEDRADPEVPTATYQIYQYIEKALRGEASTHVNRASSATSCFKRRWLQRNGVVGTPLTPRKAINFLLGALTESVVLYFIREGCVGPGKLYSEVDFGEEFASFPFQGKELKLYRQENLFLVINRLEGDDFPEDLLITAHADGFGKRNADGKWELIEVKSAAEWGFKEFQAEGPGDYLKQAHTVISTEKAQLLGVDSVRYFYLKKSTGHLWDRRYEFDPGIWEQTVREFKIAASKTEPAKPYSAEPELYRGKPTGKMTLPFPCNGYCPYTANCFPGHRVEWARDQWGTLKPKFYV